MTHRRGHLTGMAALAVGLTLLVCAPVAGATVFTVNTTADHFDQVCDADCTIRDALANANSTTDSVAVPAGVYVLNPQLGELDLVGDKLNGAGARSTIIDGGGATRVMAVTNDVPPTGPSIPSQVAGVTIRNGSALGAATTNVGGGIQVTSGRLGLVNSAVINNTAQGDGGGIGLGSGDELVMVGSTVAGNRTTGVGTRGGGIFSANEGLVMLVVNSTVTGNTAVADGGAYYGGGGSTLQLRNATIAGNSSAAGTGGIRLGLDSTFQNSIIAGNSGPQCDVTGSTITSNNSLASDATCGLAGSGDQASVNPALGPLTNNGGPTDTRSIGPAGPATDHGGAGCQATDQRGVARPQGRACDVGAFEYRPPRLTVFTHVTNDDGGTLTPGDFTLHVRSGGNDVAGSPQPGSAGGRAYVSLAPGTYTVGEDADARYTASLAGSCTSAGVVTLTEGAIKTCTITNNDKPPVVGRSVNAELERGTVKIKLPERKHFRKLTQGEQLPMGTIIDTRNGRIGITAAANRNGGRATAVFYAGLFRLGQTKGRRPITVLTLVERLTGCTAKKATTARKKKRRRRLWGDGKGRFRTKGRRSAATVVGTKWLVEDRCTSTLTRVVRGRVQVRDFVKHKTVIVRRGHRYIARAN